MQVAQSLYEGVEINNRRQGIITYMRTDSIRLSPQFINQAKKVIEEDFGENYVGKAYSAKSGENIQDAHEAIRPTNPSFRPSEIEEFLTPDQFKLYSLIYARTLSSMMTPKETIQSTVVVESNGVEFETVGNKLVFDGYLKLYSKYEKETKNEEFDFEVGNVASIQKVTPKQKFTKAPSRYNEGQLVRKMEESGIGRPSTYVATIENIKTKKYVSVKGGYLTPTDQGKITIEQLNLFFPKLISIPYTAYLETKLDEIEKGSADELSILKELNGEKIDIVKYDKDLKVEWKVNYGSSKHAIYNDILVDDDKIYVVGKNDERVGIISIYKSDGDYVSTTKYKNTDMLVGIAQANTADVLLAFTNKGNYLYLPVFEFPEMKWKDEGNHLNSIITMNGDEKVIKAFLIKDFNVDVLEAE